MTWLLRRAGLDDLDAIMAIENSTFGTDAWAAATMRQELQNPHGHYLVAVRVDDQATVDGYGGVMAPAGAEDADIQTIAVSAAARRHGLGRTMMLQLMTEARQRGAARIFLEVRADNPGAQTLYEKLGFERVALRKRYYQPDGMDAIVMRHQIVAPEARLTMGAES